jgi:thiol:disulfide interchange protein DsbA
VKINDEVKKHRRAITNVLALAGALLMFYYNYCNTACSSLKGDIWGIDLKWVGIAYMAVIIAFASFRQRSFLRALLAAGLGVEVHLYVFQVQNDVYCPFCLAFSVMLILSFIINYEVPSAWRENRQRMWLYFLGEVSFPMFKLNKLPLLIFSLLGYLTILFTFSGSVTPAYGQDKMSGVPSLGKGEYEVLVFADYFCPPCKRIDKKAEPLMKELLATKKVKITFVDVPFNRVTPIYARYYLYAVNTGANSDKIFSIRNALFKAAQEKNILTEEALTVYLKENKIEWRAFDEKPVFAMMSEIIKRNKIERTPTCVIRNPAAGENKYIGDEEIWNGLTHLKTILVAGKQ